MSRYSYVIDGEVVGIFQVPDSVDGLMELPPSLEKLHAILKSNPTIVELLEEYGQVDEGYIWDGTSFTPPVL